MNSQTNSQTNPQTNLITIELSPIDRFIVDKNCFNSIISEKYGSCLFAVTGGINIRGTPVSFKSIVKTCGFTLVDDHINPIIDSTDEKHAECLQKLSTLFPNFKICFYKCRFYSENQEAQGNRIIDSNPYLVIGNGKMIINIIRKGNNNYEFVTINIHELSQNLINNEKENEKVKESEKKIEIEIDRPTDTIQTENEIDRTTDMIQTKIDNETNSGTNSETKENYFSKICMLVREASDLFEIEKKEKELLKTIDINKTSELIELKRKLNLLDEKNRLLEAEVRRGTQLAINEKLAFQKELDENEKFKKTIVDMYDKDLIEEREKTQKIMCDYKQKEKENDNLYLQMNKYEIKITTISSEVEHLNFELNKLRRENVVDLNALNQIKKKQIDELNTLTQKHVDALDMLKQEHNNVLNALKHIHINDLDALKQEHADKLIELKKVYKGKLNSLKLKLCDATRQGSSLEKLSTTELVNKIENDEQYEEIFIKLNKLSFDYSNDMTAIDQKRQNVIDLMRAMHAEFKRKKAIVDEENDDENDGENDGENVDNCDDENVDNCDDKDDEAVDKDVDTNNEKDTLHNSERERLDAIKLDEDYAFALHLQLQEDGNAQR